jgi:hypothetical protein
MIDSEIRFSIVAGGPLYHLLRTAHLVPPNRFHATLPAVAVIAFAWLPLMAIETARRLATGAFDALIHDYSVHTRMLVSVPLFFAAESALEYHVDLAIRRFERGGFSADTPNALHEVLDAARRRRDRAWPELVLLIAAWGSSLGALSGAGFSSGWVQTGVDLHGVAVARAWYELVVLPIYQFLVGRWLWRWLIWTRLLFELSRLRLRLMPTHPDYGGGILHLSNPIAAFAVFAAGLSTVAAAGWYTNIGLGYARAPKFVPAIGLLLVAVEVVAFTPLFTFVRTLSRARRDGLTEYSLLALHLTRSFHRRWIENPKDDDSILDRSDVSELTDLMSSYQGLTQMRVVPFNPRASIALALAVLIPMLPVAATEVPLPQLLSKLARALLT